MKAKNASRTKEGEAQERHASELSSKIKILRELLPELQESFGVRSLGIFGSYVRGRQRRNSDIDILVDFHREPTLFSFIRLEKHLTDKLGLKVDLVMKNALKHTIGQHILRELVPV